MLNTDWIEDTVLHTHLHTHLHKNDLHTHLHKVFNVTLHNYNDITLLDKVRFLMISMRVWYLKDNDRQLQGH